MGKMSRGTSWREHRLADRMELDDTTYTVDLVGRRATGVQGYRMTVVYLPHADGEEVEVSLPNASSTAEFHRIARELEADPDRIVELFRASRSA